MHVYEMVEVMCACVQDGGGDVCMYTRWWR